MRNPYCSASFARNKAFRHLAAARFNQLAPWLQVPPASGSNSLSFRFQLLSLPGQRYVSYRSTDLKQWTSISTNLGTGDWVDIIDTNFSQNTCLPD